MDALDAVALKGEGRASEDARSLSAGLLGGGADGALIVANDDEARISCRRPGGD